MTDKTTTGSDAVDLLPCPFCGGTNIDPAEWSGNDGNSGPGCGDCGALAETARDWNRRVPIAQARAAAPAQQAARAVDALDGMGFTYDEEIGWLPPKSAAEPAAILEGFALAPLEPTDEMYNAACHAYHAWRFTTNQQADWTHRDTYRAMLAAAPVIAAPTAPTDLTPLDYRAQGREEALAIILGQDPENPFADHTSSVFGGEDYSTEWDEAALRELLHIGDRKHDAYDRAEAAYWDALGRSEEAKREMLFVQQAPFYKPLHDFLAKHGAWDLMGDLKRAAPTATAEPVARTYMTDEQAEKWAWEQVKRDVGTDGWTAGDNCNYFGFFLWGWRYRSQYESQRAAPAPQQAAPLTVHTPEFRKLMTEYDDEANYGSLNKARANLVAFINAKIGVSAGSAASAGDATTEQDAALFRLVVESGMQLHFEGGDGEDDAVWVDDLMKWSDGDRLNATRALIEEVAKDRAAMAATKEKKQ